MQYTTLKLTTLAAAAVAALASQSNAAVIAAQGFEAVPAANNWGYTLTGTGGTVSTNKGLYDSPESNARVIEGNQSFQRIAPSSGNVASTLSFVPISTSADGGNSVSIRLGAHAVGNATTASGNGVDAGDTVKVYIALDVPLDTLPANVTYLSTPDITIAGNTNARWSYNTGTGTATADITQNTASRTFVSLQTGKGTAADPAAAFSDRTTDGYSTLVLNLPDSATSFAMKVVVVNDTTTEAWLMDNIQVTAVPEPATLGLVAVGGALAMARRRRTR